MVAPVSSSHLTSFHLESKHPIRGRAQLDVIKVQGKWREVKVFEVLRESSVNLGPEEELYCRAYGEAFAACLSGDFHPAQAKFQKALSLRPDDPASKDMIERIDRLEPDNLPADWDGSISLTSK